MKTTRFIDTAMARHDRLSMLITTLNQKVELLPDGKVKIRHRGINTYYFYCDNGKYGIEVYVKPSDINLVRDIIQKTYLEKVIRTAQIEKDLIGHLISRYPDKTVEEIYEAMDEDRRKFITPIRRPDEEYINDWLNIPFKTKGIPEGEPSFTTLKGEHVKSKSEQLIADRLFINNIPYKYECPLVLSDGGTIHPDFTILRVSDRKIIYLEHCGKMDDPNYARTEVIRTNRYAHSGILQGDRLFHLYESSVTPLDTDVLTSMLELFR